MAVVQALPYGVECGAEGRLQSVDFGARVDGGYERRISGSRRPWSGRLVEEGEEAAPSRRLSVWSSVCGASSEQVRSWQLAARLVGGRRWQEESILPEGEARGAGRAGDGCLMQLMADAALAWAGGVAAVTAAAVAVAVAVAASVGWGVRRQKDSNQNNRGGTGSSKHQQYEQHKAGARRRRRANTPDKEAEAEAEKRRLQLQIDRQLGGARKLHSNTKKSAEKALWMSRAAPLADAMQSRREAQARAKARQSKAKHECWGGGLGCGSGRRGLTAPLAYLCRGVPTAPRHVAKEGGGSSSSSSMSDHRCRFLISLACSAGSACLACCDGISPPSSGPQPNLSDRASSFVITSRMYGWIAGWVAAAVQPDSGSLSPNLGGAGGGEIGKAEPPSWWAVDASQRASRGRQWGYTPALTSRPCGQAAKSHGSDAFSFRWDSNLDCGIASDPTAKPASFGPVSGLGLEPVLPPQLVTQACMQEKRPTGFIVSSSHHLMERAQGSKH
ncbi:hypothetical protein L1887_48968 [Cichorium endivia]|nr:hypothetical protein L1887_48968 [Cichorium endivia]